MCSALSVYVCLYALISVSVLVVVSLSLSVCLAFSVAVSHRFFHFVGICSCFIVFLSASMTACVCIGVSVEVTMSVSLSGCVDVFLRLFRCMSVVFRCLLLPLGDYYCYPFICSWVIGSLPFMSHFRFLLTFFPCLLSSSLPPFPAFILTSFFEAPHSTMST